MYAKTPLLAGVALVAMSANAFSQSLSANAGSDTPGFAAATLAPLGSFEFDIAPLYTRLAVLLHQATVALSAHSIDVEKAVYIQAQADKVRALLDESLKACGEDAKGQCAKSPKKAQALVVRASTALASIN